MGIDETDECKITFEIFLYVYSKVILTFGIVLCCE